MRVEFVIEDEDEAARRLARVGSALLRSRPHAFHPTLLVAEVEADRAAVSIYKAVGGDIVYVIPHNANLLYRRLIAQWTAWAPGHRWCTIEYLMRDGRFEVAYRCAPAPDAAIDDIARRQAVVRAFGDRPVLYPRWVTGESSEDPAEPEVEAMGGAFPLP